MVEEGMNKTFKRETFVLEAIHISMEPMPTALVELPPNPFMLIGGMGQSDLKSKHSGETWQFTPESRIKGAVGRWDMGAWLAV